jgi:hydrogenase-1 operon protein HyaF
MSGLADGTEARAAVQGGTGGGLADIAVRVEGEEGGLGGIVPILREIESLLARLVARGESGSIDLRSLPLSEAEREELRARLGEGEVRASVQAAGESEICETGVHAVWWVTHRNTDGVMAAEFIEVTPVPEILKTHPADMRAALARLGEDSAAKKGS